MSTVASRKCVKLVYGFLVLFLMTICFESAKKPVFTTTKKPSNPVTTNKYAAPTTTTTPKPKSVSDSDELLTIIQGQSKLKAPEVNPSSRDPCVLGSAELYLSWWINENGSLAGPDEIVDMTMDFSGFEVTNSTTIADEIRSIRANHIFGEPEPDIVFMSIANSNLTKIPKDALDLVDHTLEYLSLTGNDFSDVEPETDHNHVSSSQAPSLFNRMAALKELDMRKSNIYHLRDGAFENLVKLEKLFLSHNYIDEIGTTVFIKIPHLIHLDLSHNVVDEIILTRGALTKTFEGIKFDNEFQFSQLEKLCSSMYHTRKYRS